MIFFPYTLASSPDWLYNKIFCTAWEANSVFPLAWIQEIQFLLMILAVSYGFTTVISHASFVTSSATSSVLSSSRRGEPEGLPVPWWWSWVGGGSGKHLWSKSHMTPMEGQSGFWFRSSVRGQWQADDQWGGQGQAVTEAWAGGTQCGQSTGPTCNLRTTTLGRDCVPWLTPLAGLLLPPWGPRTCQALEGACANDRPWSIRLIASL